MKSSKKVLQIFLTSIFLCMLLLGAVQFILLPMEKDTSELAELESGLDATLEPTLPIPMVKPVQDPLVALAMTQTITQETLHLEPFINEYKIPIVIAKPRPEFNSMNVTLVGDSVMLGAVPALQSVLPSAVIDAKTSRQVFHALPILQELNARGQLGSIVVIALGLNGPFKESLGQDIIDYLGPDRHVYWVNTYGRTVAWQNESNNTIQAIVDANENVDLIDWCSLAPQHEDWFYSDGMHLKEAGQEGYAQFIYDSIHY